MCLARREPAIGMMAAIGTRHEFGWLLNLGLPQPSSQSNQIQPLGGHRENWR